MSPSSAPPGEVALARIHAALTRHGLYGPAAYLDLDAFDRNAAALLSRTGGKPIRVASKSVRVPQLLERVLASSGQYRGILAFSAREAVHLATRHDLDDLLVAYPTSDAVAVAQLARLVAAGKQMTLMADSEAQLPMLETAARAAGTQLAVCLDLDVSQEYPGLRFGMFRSPLNDVNSVLRLADRLGRSPWLRLDGLMAYEGQVAGPADAARDPRTLAIRELKRRALPDIAARRAAVVDALGRAGHQLRFVNAGGTGSLESSAAEACVTELAAGSGLFSPALFDGYQGFRHEPAAGFALSVTRQPTRNVVTCLGGGYVASGAAGVSRLPVSVWPPGLKLLPDEGAGEVQTPLRVPPGVQLNFGDLVLFRHAKAGELCEHFNEIYVVQGGEVVGTLPTYRGEGVQFP